VTAQPGSTPSTDGAQRRGVHHVSSGGREEYHAGVVGGGAGAAAVGGGVGAGAREGEGDGDGGGSGERRGAGIDV